MVGGKFVPPIIQTSVKFRDFEELYLRQFSTNHCQTWQFYLLIGALSGGVDEFLLTCPCQKLKKQTNKQTNKPWVYCTVLYSHHVPCNESSNFCLPSAVLKHHIMISFCLSPEYQWEIAIEKKLYIQRERIWILAGAGCSKSNKTIKVIYSD